MGRAGPYPGATRQQEEPHGEGEGGQEGREEDGGEDRRQDREEGQKGRLSDGGAACLTVGGSPPNNPTGGEIEVTWILISMMAGCAAFIAVILGILLSMRRRSADNFDGGFSHDHPPVKTRIWADHVKSEEKR